MIDVYLKGAYNQGNMVVIIHICTSGHKSQLVELTD